MIARLANFARTALTEGLLMLSGRRRVSKEHRGFIRKALDKPLELLLLGPLAGRVKSLEDCKLCLEMLRLKPYAQRVLADRYWLEDALERKEEVMSFLDQSRGQETAQGAFRGEFDQFTALAGTAPRLPIRTEDINPQLNDRASGTPIDRHYVYHPAWAARILAKTGPAKHVDISSIVSFVSVVSAFVPVDFYDFRPAPVELDGLYSGAANLMQLPFADDSISSLSCMHVIEHIGLGRYGDPLDPDGDLKAIGELVRVLAPGGNLLVATPVGRPRVEFNAHRVYDHEAFAQYFAPLELVEFALIRERGDSGLVVAPPAEIVRAESYGCGCFWFRKPKAEQHMQAEAAGVGAQAV